MQGIIAFVLFGIVTQKIGDDKSDLGILALSMAIGCWFISGLFSLFSNELVVNLATSICSSLNSCFLLLFLRHLDKEDLPASFRDYFPSRHTIWTLFIVLVLITLTLACLANQTAYLMLLPDLIFSFYTVCIIGLSFFYLLTARTNSIGIGLLSCFPILITLLAEVYRLLSLMDKNGSGWDLILANQTLLFTYKPLLIISYFVLIYSWQLKRIRQNEQVSREGISLVTQSSSLSEADVSTNRARYRLLGPKDWMILESLARGEKATVIAGANPLEFPNGAKGVDDRIGAIAREFQLAGQSQMKIVVTALKRGLLRLEDIA